MDWNNDGKKDLIIGAGDGYVRIYLNTGTDEAPNFKYYSYLMVGGSTFSVGTYSFPHVVDWNNDGKKDVVCGEYLGKVWLLLNQGTDANPVFNSSSKVKDGAVVLDVGKNSSLTTPDLDGDGKKDLLVGDIMGELHFFSNVGTDSNPAFNGKVMLQEDGSNYDVGNYSKPEVVDFNQDGTLDIVCGNVYGEVFLLKSAGSLFITKNFIPAIYGAGINFFIDAPDVYNGRFYAIFGSISGTEPGLPLSPGVVIPINWDSFTQLLIPMINSPVLQDFAGNLDANGMAQARMDTHGPLPPEAVGLVMNFAYALMDYPFDFASNPVTLEILP